MQDQIKIVRITKEPIPNCFGGDTMVGRQAVIDEWGNAVIGTGMGAFTIAYGVYEYDLLMIAKVKK